MLATESPIIRGACTRHGTRARAEADLFDYIVPFYNRKGRHSMLGYSSPVAFLENWIGTRYEKKLAEYCRWVGRRKTEVSLLHLALLQIHAEAATNRLLEMSKKVKHPIQKKEIAIQAAMQILDCPWLPEPGPMGM